METLPFTPAFDDPTAKLKLKLEGEIERLRHAIGAARYALEDGRRGDALGLLRAACPGHAMAPTRITGEGAA